MGLNPDRADLALRWVNRILMAGILGLLAVFLMNLYVHTRLESLLESVTTKDDIFQLNPLNIAKLEFVERTTHSHYPTDIYILRPFRHIKIIERFHRSCESPEPGEVICKDDLSSTHHILVATRYLKKSWFFYTDKSGKIIRRQTLDDS